jgi:predicted Na+-dependent transporter
MKVLPGAYSLTVPFDVVVLVVVVVVSVSAAMANEAQSAINGIMIFFIGCFVLLARLLGVLMKSVGDRASKEMFPRSEQRALIVSSA